MPSQAILFLGVFLGATCAAEPINFSRQIRPILSENCIACHGPDEKGRKGKLRLDDEQDAKRDRKGDFVILPGKPEQSELIKRIESTDPDDVMPPPKQHKTISRFRSSAVHSPQKNIHANNPSVSPTSTTPAKFTSRSALISTAPDACSANPDRKSTRLNSSHSDRSRMPSSA